MSHRNRLSSLLVASVPLSSRAIQDIRKEYPVSPLVVCPIGEDADFTPGSVFQAAFFEQLRYVQQIATSGVIAWICPNRAQQHAGHKSFSDLLNRICKASSPELFFSTIEIGEHRLASSAKTLYCHLGIGEFAEATFEAVASDSAAAQIIMPGASAAFTGSDHQLDLFAHMARQFIKGGGEKIIFVIHKYERAFITSRRMNATDRARLVAKTGAHLAAVLAPECQFRVEMIHLDGGSKSKQAKAPARETEVAATV